MPDDTTPRFEIRPEVIAAMRQWPVEQQAAVNAVRPLADSGDIPANFVAAWMYQHINWVEGVPYARRLLDAGLASFPLLQNYVANMFTDAGMRPEAIAGMRLLIDSGVQMDPVGQAFAMVQQGDEAAGRELLELSLLPVPSGARQQWDQLMSQTSASADAVIETAARVASERERVIDAMRVDEQDVRADRDRMKQLVEEVGDLAHEGAGRILAKEYADRAKEVEDKGSTYTLWSIRAGVAAAIFSAAIAVVAFTQESGVGPILTKASLAIPVLAVAGYLSRLATVHRRQAWRWRHMELQIRTADPFLAPLEDETRKALIAALALRFFPGQRHSDEEGGKVDPTSEVDPAAVISEILRPIGGSPRPGDSSTPPPEA
jgi:hypothetical protein